MASAMKKYNAGEGETMMWRRVAILHVIVMESLSDELTWKQRPI